MIIAGPCSAETREQVMDTALQLRKLGIEWFRAGLWKPRTYPGCFEGVGEKGLQWLSEVKRQCGMKVCTEVSRACHVEACAKAGVDMVWIGARTTANPFLVQEIAQALPGTGMSVFVKNPVNPDLEAWTGAVERLRTASQEKIGLIHRGFSSFNEKIYRNSAAWDAVVQMRSRFPELPLYCDPSHLGGKVEYVREISQKALDLGLDGLMIESHCNPSAALSDSAQQLTPARLAALLDSLEVRAKDTGDAKYTLELEEYRAQIDALDETIVDALASRMELSRKIGALKKIHNVSIIQARRWDTVMKRIVRIGNGRGLSDDFVRRVFDEIHKGSVNEQETIPDCSEPRHK